MADVHSTDLTRLDAPALQTFIDTDVSHFIDDITHVRAPGQTPLSLYDVGSSSSHPLHLGNLEGDDNTGGKSVVTNMKTAATAIDNVFNKHVTAFTALRGELQDVIKDLLKAHGENLTSIQAQKFLTAIDGYEAGIGDTGGLNPPTTNSSK
ncbi:type VII secretion system-associated protein [Streptomyces broussonetiae]|uniref:type VII secretion system-associated protein n=1 Tax=Streptomyces broussonetiae TaxID=2686304 RepID=UPI0035DB03E9